MEYIVYKRFPWTAPRFRNVSGLYIRVQGCMRQHLYLRYPNTIMISLITTENDPEYIVRITIFAGL